MRPCAALRCEKPHSAGNAQGSTGNARAWRRAFLHPDDSAHTLRRLSYRRHTQYHLYMFIIFLVYIVTELIMLIAGLFGNYPSSSTDSTLESVTMIMTLQIQTV